MFVSRVFDYKLYNGQRMETDDCADSSASHERERCGVDFCHTNITALKQMWRLTHKINVRRKFRFKI